jgi:hypothetical protein
MLSNILAAFAPESPISIMMRGLMEPYPDPITR